MQHSAETIAAWRKLRQLGDLEPYRATALAIFAEIEAAGELDDLTLGAIVRRYPRDGNLVFSKNQLVQMYRQLCAEGTLVHDAEILARLRMKPTRTLSGVATVTVLTRPHPCPGGCIFCPDEAGMPKSYLVDEPGAQRAAQHAFDPFEQVRARLTALYSNGHLIDKVELLILGGSWPSYPRDYQAWFVRRCLEGMHAGVGGTAGEPASAIADRLTDGADQACAPGAADGARDASAADVGAELETLVAVQQINETAAQRNVGLVVELRPDQVDPEEIRWLRQLGVTKVQLGVQSLDDAILALNRRGHDTAATRQAMELLRAAGLKLVVHWMPNLLGATPAGDRVDFVRLWEDEALRPDELKIYPCSLIEQTELCDLWRRGGYTPYDEETLIELVAACKLEVPVYCRINRIYRDIPGTRIVAGSKLSNLRQAAQQRLAGRGEHCRCIRCREVRGARVEVETLELAVHAYATSASREFFLAFHTPDGRLAGYARLSLPGRPVELGLPELTDAALIREVHVYGPALAIGSTARGEAQHSGLGTRLLAEAERIAAESGYGRMAVIAAVGTRRYYAGRGYAVQGTYMVKALDQSGLREA